MTFQLTPAPLKKKKLEPVDLIIETATTTTIEDVLHAFAIRVTIDEAKDFGSDKIFADAFEVPGSSPSGAARQPSHATTLTNESLH